MAEKLWKTEAGWVLLSGLDDDPEGFLPYNVETRMAMIVDDDGAPQTTVPAMLRDGVEVIGKDDPRFPKPPG
jgi:hypothetical protein